MKMELAKTSPQLGGDIFSLARLLTMLEDYKEDNKLEAHKQATLNLWIKYLGNIENQLLRDNYGGKPPTLTFDLPFEKDFMEEFTRLEGEQTQALQGNKDD